MEDRDLVIAFKAGKPGAYDEMYRRYSARVRGICRRMLANSDDAQEAVQETFLKAYVALPQFNGNYRLGAWLGRIASNVCLDALRARGRVAQVVPLRPDSEALGIETSAEEVVVGREPELAESMGGIQPLHARALVMRGVEGLSHREIAGQLSMTPAQVKALLHRARRSFKRTWDEAKGWALAPLVWIKSFARGARGVSASSSEIAGAAAGASPFLAERVAASAVIVAAALTGIPGATTTVAGPVDGYGKKPLDAIERTVPATHAHVKLHSLRSADMSVGREMPSGDATVVTGGGRSVVAGLGKLLTKTTKPVTRRQHEDRTSKDGPVTTAASVIQTTAKRAGKDIDKLLPPR